MTRQIIRITLERGGALYVTAFHGGRPAGRCIQLTIEKPKDNDYCQLTKDEVGRLTTALTLWEIDPHDRP